MAEDGAELNLPASIFHAEISGCLRTQFLWGAGSGTQGFVNARQAPCLLSYFSGLQPALCIPLYMSPGMDHHPLKVTVCLDQAGVVQKLPHEGKLQWTWIKWSGGSSCAEAMHAEWAPHTSVLLLVGAG